MKTRESHTFLSVRFIFPHLNCRFIPKAHLIVNLLSNTSFLLSSLSFCVFKIKFFCAIPCKLKKNNLYLRLEKNNLNVHAYEDNVDFTNFSPLDIKNATFAVKGDMQDSTKRLCINQFSHTRYNPSHFYFTDFLSLPFLRVSYQTEKEHRQY